MQREVHHWCISIYKVSESVPYSTDLLTFSRFTGSNSLRSCLSTTEHLRSSSLIVSPSFSWHLQAHLSLKLRIYLSRDKGGYTALRTRDIEEITGWVSWKWSQRVVANSMKMINTSKRKGFSVKFPLRYLIPQFLPDIDNRILLSNELVMCIVCVGSISNQLASLFTSPMYTPVSPEPDRTRCFSSMMPWHSNSWNCALV